LGTVGDLAVFSMRKSLPIPNGGLLVINTPRLQSTAKLSRPPPFATWSKIFDLWAVSLRRVTPGKTRSLAAIGLARSGR
jgi:hypothetical protein